jgi:hypothetical protein
MINQEIAESMLVEFDGCDNDCPGSLDAPAVWVFGIEPGDSIADKLARSKAGTDQNPSVSQSYSVERQLKWPFNQKAFKLLAAIEGETDYKAFATKKQPFVEGSEGYFKGNIYPFACNNVAEWSSEIAAEVGCNKQTYIQWCNDHRIPVIHSWVKKYQPKVFIGVGASYKTIFSRAVFGREVDLKEILISGKSQVKTIFSHIEDGYTLVVIPHFSGPYGMNCNKSIQGAGQYIAGLIEAKHP